MSDQMLPPENGTSEVNAEPATPAGLEEGRWIEVPELVVHRPQHLTLVPSGKGGVDEATTPARDTQFPDPEHDSALLRLCALFGATTPEEALPRAEEMLRRFKSLESDTPGGWGAPDWGTWDKW
jgi:hypothetical protein